MIIKFGVLIALILGALLFVGVKMGEDINVREVKMFFFILYGMSIFTVFNIIISVYFFTSLRNKRGPPGPKGKPGRLGDKGDDGKCVEDNCLKKSLETIIVETLEKRLAEEYDKAMKAAKAAADTPRRSAVSRSISSREAIRSHSGWRAGTAASGTQPPSRTLRSPLRPRRCTLP